MGKIDDRLAELKLVLPAATEPTGPFVNVVRAGNLLFTAGHVSQTATGEFITGKVGKDLTPEEGYAAAQRVVLSLLATLKKELGSLDDIKRVVKLTGFVNCVDGFTNQPAVMNGASDTIALIFGDKIKHARSALGMNALPFNVAVEIEAIVEVVPSAASLSKL
ncbi:hypothetical protein Gpo141_00011517 [Globisporangium polare]